MPGEAWPEVPLAEILDRLEVGIASIGPEAPPGNREWGVIRLGAVTSGKFIPDQAKRLPDSVDPRPSLEINPCDVLLVRVNGSPDLVGSVCVVDRTPPRLMLSDLVMRLVPNPGVMDRAFLGMVLSAPPVRRQIDTKLRGTSGQFQLPQSELKSVLIPCPPIAEQQRIVSILEGITAMEKKVEATIAKFEALRCGLMEELADLECGHFGEVLKQGPQSGIYKPARSYGLQGTPIVRIDSYSGGKSDLTRGLLRVSVNGGEIARYGLDVGDIIINRVNTPDLVGKSTSVRRLIEPTIFESNMMRCKLHRPAADPVFTEVWLGSSMVKRHFLQHAKSAIFQASINGDDVRNCPFPRMGLPEQLAFLERLNAVDDQRLAEEAELAKLCQIKQGLVDDLLSGQVAVPVEAA